MAVAQARSFTAAAQRMGMSRATVTKQVSALEARLGVQLLNRNTQHVAPTEAGSLMLDQAAHLLGGFQELESAVRSAAVAPAGMIRVGVPPSFGAAHLAPMVVAFTRQHAGMQVTLCLDRGDAELVRDGLDLSLRIASSLKDASYIARLIVKVPQILVASPAYLECRGMPAELIDLRSHDCLVHTLKSPRADWSFEDGHRVVTVPVLGSLTADFGEPLRVAALLGQGISMHPIYMVADDVAAGRLAVVLPGIPPVGLSIHAIYPQRRLPGRVQIFLDFLMAWLRQGSGWPPAA